MDVGPRGFPVVNLAVEGHADLKAAVQPGPALAFEPDGHADVVVVDRVVSAVAALDGPGPAAIFSPDVEPPVGGADRRQPLGELRVGEHDFIACVAVGHPNHTPGRQELDVVAVEVEHAGLDLVTGRKRQEHQPVRREANAPRRGLGEIRVDPHPEVDVAAERDVRLEIPLGMPGDVQVGVVRLSWEVGRGRRVGPRRDRSIPLVEGEAGRQEQRRLPAVKERKCKCAMEFGVVRPERPAAQRGQVVVLQGDLLPQGRHGLQHPEGRRRLGERIG